MYQRIREMRRRGHVVHLVAAEDGVEPGARESALATLRELCETVDVYPRSMKSALHMPDAVLRMPYAAVSRIPDRRTAQLLTDLASRCDVLQVEHSAMVPAARIARRDSRLPAVIMLHSDGFASMERVARSDSVSIARRAAYHVEARRMGFVEDCILGTAEFDQVLFVSKEHCDAARRGYPHRADRFSFVPLSCEGSSGEGAASEVVSGETPTILLIASFLDDGNRMAAVWFVDHVLPIVRRSRQVRVLLVGRAAAVMSRCADPWTEVVDSPPEVGSYYDRATLAVVPVMAGGGVRVKLLEAIARRRPVVSTMLGIEGTDFQPGEDVLVGDTAEAFAGAILQSLLDPAKAGTRVASAYAKLIRIHSIQAVGDRQEAAFQAAVPGRAGLGLI